MTEYIAPGRMEVHLVATIANVAAPTTTELNAGTDITAFVIGVPNVPRTANLADNADLSSKFEKRQVGTRGGDVLDVTVKRHAAAADDDAYVALAEDTVTHVVIARSGLATAGTFAVGDRVDVYPVTVASLEDGTPARNEIDRAIAHCAITADPTRGYALAS